jgi:hypothetical protein
MEAIQQYDSAMFSVIRDILIEDPHQRWKLPNISWLRPLSASAISIG